MLLSLPAEVLLCVLHYLPADSIIALGITNNELNNSNIWKLYCCDKGIKLENEEDEEEWKIIVKRMVHIPPHINNSHISKLMDYDDESTLKNKKKVWNNIFSKWPKYSTKKRNDIRAAIIQGVPMSMRGLFWKFCLSLNSFPTVNYEQLLTSNEWREDIPHFLNLDYPRFSTSTQKSVYRNVLCALSAYDQEVLYTPAMGNLATMLLNYLSEEDAFKALATLMGGKYKFKGMFAEGLPELHTKGRLFDFLFQHFLPKVYAKCHMAVDHIISIPMLGIFTSVHPNIGMHRIWDLVMFDGYDVILSVLLALLEIHSGKFLKYNEEQIFMSFIRLGCVDDVAKNKSINIEYKNNKKDKKEKKEKKDKDVYGSSIISVGETIRLDRLLDITCKYHKKITGVLNQFVM